MSGDTDTQMTSDEHRIKRPGFGLPIEYLPKWTQYEETWERYPHAIADSLASVGVTVRERRMLEFINQISDKPEWERKVFDEMIVGKWHDEACKHSDEIGDEYLSEAMFNYCVAELRDKAERFKSTKIIAVMDAEATVLKSDCAVPPELVDALKKGVKSLEDVPVHMKDWHPGSDGKVLDLVHPSMYPLSYNHSRALPYGTVPLKGCIKYTGDGDIVDREADEPTDHTRPLDGWGNNMLILPAWGSFQWLPAEIRFNENGSAAIDSYVNNLHPVKHAELYPVLEKFVDCAVPLWNEAISWFHNRIRIRVDGTSDEDYHIPDGMKYDGQSDHSESSDFWYDDQNYLDWKERTRVLTHPEPKQVEDYVSFEKSIEILPKGAHPVDLRKKFAESGLQVIFKLANIHLTPEKPQYEGGSWHVEGALNEHICATALYYYDQDNITDSFLSFRQEIDTEEMTMKPAQSEYSSLERYYGVEQDGPAIQELGKVLTREGRMLAFPNVLQHCVHSFRLKDETKPGHRKILAMFLVDPHVKILSTANVPPQQKDWWAEEVRLVEPLASLPQEIFDQIIKAVDDFPIDYERSCEIRDKLMGERGAMNDKMNDGIIYNTFFFCEH